jgi:peptidoglycan hydrolase CwlO-like protein
LERRKEIDSMPQNKKLTTGAVLGTALMLMGLSVPSCPNQQETEKKIQEVHAKATNVEKSVSTNTDKIRGLENEVGELKKAHQEVAEVLKTHKGSIDELTAKIGELSSRGGAGGAKKPAPRRR